MASRTYRFFFIIPEADVGVMGVDRDDLPVVDGDRLAALFLLPVVDLAAHILLHLFTPKFISPMMCSLL